jgi:hypothetical protein
VIEHIEESKVADAHIDKEESMLGGSIIIAGR